MKGMISFGRTDEDHESPSSFQCPKAKARLPQGVTAKTHSQGDRQPLVSNQKTILTGTGRKAGYRGREKGRL